MQDHVDACLPEEACGLLAGRDGRVRMALAVHNVLQSTTRFRMDPQGQISALGRIEDEGEELIGIYHSHPDGPPHPSATDLAEAAFPEVEYLIWSHGEGSWRCEGFHLEAGRFVPLTIEWLSGATPFGDECS